MDVSLDKNDWILVTEILSTYLESARKHARYKHYLQNPDAIATEITRLEGITGSLKEQIDWAAPVVADFDTASRD